MTSSRKFSIPAIAVAFTSGIVVSAFLTHPGHSSSNLLTNTEPKLAAALPEQKPIGTLEDLTVDGVDAVWTTDQGLSENGHRLIDQIRLIEFDGLDPERYHLATLNELASKEWRPGLQTRFEKLLTASYKQLILDLGQGVLSPKSTQRSWFQIPATVDAHREFELIARGGQSLTDSLNALRPTYGGYEKLSYALSNYRIIEHNGGWPTIPEGPTLKPGAVDDRIPLLRQRLTISKDFEGPTPERLERTLKTEPTFYTSDLEEAVKKYQRRHGLLADGFIGKQTLDSLNIPASHKVKLLEANLERMRWMPKELGERHVITNIAEYRLRVMNQGIEELSMPIVSGKPKFKTPVFSDTMEYLVINPTWTVPRSIAKRELLPKERQNRGFLKKRNYKLLREEGGQLLTIDPDSISREELYAKNFPYTIRQMPGKKNALGKVKFIFPNKYSVYLHDTPAKSLFKKTQRAYSHGCIRLGDPQALARTLLAHEGWDGRRVDKAFAKKETRKIMLKEPIPNHIVYLTSWVEDGEVQFRPDVYGHDKDLLQALKSPAKVRWPASLFTTTNES